MACIYLPSCNFTAFAPTASKQIIAYLKERFNISPAACCRKTYQSFTAQDTVVYICNTCMAICEEASQAKELISIWEIIAGDGAFVYPNYQGRKITVQDCWRTRDKSAQQEAVRYLLQKMNFNVQEQKERLEQTVFCGISLLTAPREENKRLAPKRFVENAQGLFLAHSPEQQNQLMQKHCQALSTELVACYCVPCLKGINAGGKKGLHLLELLLHPAGVQ